MIVEGICNLIFSMGTFIITLIPKIAELPIVGFSYLNGIVKYALWFFPMELWIVIIGNITFWITASFSWSLIEWAYKKIPGVS